MIRVWLWRAVCVAGLPLGLMLFWWWLGDVDYPRGTAADAPSALVATVLNDSDLVTQGREWARTNGITRHQDCDSALENALRQRGCHREVSAGQTIPPLREWNTYPTTRVCQAAVRSHYEPLLRDMVERGNFREAEDHSRQHFEPHLRQCLSVDRARILRDVHEPLQRLQATLAHLREGVSLSVEEIEQLRREIPIVEEFQSHPMRSSYLANVQELYERVGGRERIFPLRVSGDEQELACADLARQVMVHREAHQAWLGLWAQNADGQDTSLARWTQAASDRLLMGCPPLW